MRYVAIIALGVLMLVEMALRALLVLLTLITFIGILLWLDTDLGSFMRPELRHAMDRLIDTPAPKPKPLPPADPVKSLTDAYSDGVIDETQFEALVGRVVR